MTEVEEINTSSMPQPEPEPLDANLIDEQDSGELNPVLFDVAVGTPEDTGFLTANGEADVTKAIPRQSGAEMDAYKSTSESLTVETFAQLLNFGNWLEMQASLEVAGSQLGSTMQQWTSAIMAIGTMAFFHYARLKTLLASTTAEAQSFIEQVKSRILSISGIPDGLRDVHICWDALSYKVLPNSLEFLMYKFPSQTVSLSVEQCAMIGQIEDECLVLIEQKCGEFRQRSGTSPDDFIPDLSLFLELHCAGAAEDDRPQRVSNIGQGRLIEYVNKMQNVFLSGNLPGTLQPSKIYACHDAVTQSELRGSIQKLGERQIYQQAHLVPSVRVMARAYYLASNQDFAGRDWGSAAQASISIKKTVDSYMNRASATLGVRLDKPMSILENQIAGSANTLTQQVQAAAGELVVHQNEGQKQVSVQQLSLLLACLRMRANAVQTSEWELLPSDDLDHIEIVKQLAHGAGSSAVGGGDTIFRIATVLGESYSRGHNVTKFGGKTLPAQLHDLIMYSVEGRVKNLSASIQLFQDVPQLAQALASCVIYSLTQRQRVRQEFRLRKDRRSIQFKASNEQ